MNSNRPNQPLWNYYFVVVPGTAELLTTQWSCNYIAMKRLALKLGGVATNYPWLIRHGLKVSALPVWEKRPTGVRRKKDKLVGWKLTIDGQPMEEVGKAAPRVRKPKVAPKPEIYSVMEPRFATSPVR